MVYKKCFDPRREGTLRILYIIVFDHLIFFYHPFLFTCDMNRNYFGVVIIWNSFMTEILERLQCSLLDMVLDNY